MTEVVMFVVLFLIVGGLICGWAGPMAYDAFKGPKVHYGELS